MWRVDTRATPARLQEQPNPRWTDAFETARAAAIKVSFEHTRDEALVGLTKAMIAVDRLDAARAVLTDIGGEDDRLSAIRSLVEALAKARQADAALQVARLVSSDYERREIMRQVAIAFARENRMAPAIEALEETTLDGFIEAISAILAALTNPPPQAISQALSAITSVAAWVRSDWDEIATLLRA